MFNKIIPSPEVSPINAEQAQQVYSMFKDLRVETESVSTVFVNQYKYGHSFQFNQILDVSKELQALVDAAREAMMRVESTVQVVDGYDEETGDPIYKDVYTPPSPTSEQELIAELSSDLLDVPTFVADYINYMLVYEDQTSWNDFQAQFDFLKTSQNV